MLIWRDFVIEGLSYVCTIAWTTALLRGGGRPCSRRRWLANYIAETRLMTNCTAGRNMYGEGAGRWESIVDGFKDYYSDWMPRNLSGQEGGGVLLFPDHVHGGIWEDIKHGQKLAFHSGSIGGRTRRAVNWCCCCCTQWDMEGISKTYGQSCK